MITKVKIYGERCSGTNYLKKILELNFDIEFADDTFGHKHFFGWQNGRIKKWGDDILFICIVRNIQQGNIACPCCRKLPPFVSDVTDSYDLREDLIDEYNEEQKKKIFKKATRIVTSGDSSKALTKLVMTYKKVYDNVQMVKQKNKEIKKNYDEMNKKIRAIENEETKEYKEVRKKYNAKKKEIKKSFKCKKIKRVNYRPLNDAFEKIIKYMGYRPVEY